MVTWAIVFSWREEQTFDSLHGGIGLLGYSFSHALIVKSVTQLSYDASLYEHVDDRMPPAVNDMLAHGQQQQQQQ